jgi:hypothetical protein
VNTCGEGGVRKMNSTVRDMGIKTFTPKEIDELEQE